VAQIKLLKISSDGVPLEFDTAADEITLASFTVQGGGPVLGATGLDMNGQDISDLSDLVFSDPAVGTINQTAGALIANNIMAKERENLMTTAGSVSFPVITDSAGQVDAFRLPALAGTPTATPTTGGEGHVVWDSTNNKMYIWDGAAWDDQSIVSDAEKVANIYTAGDDLVAGEVVYISAANTVDKADVSSAGAASRVVGMVVAGALDTTPVNIASDGLVKTLSGLTAGSRYYADPATVGGITATLPVGTGNSIVQIGYAKSATQFHLQIAQLGRRA
jgi:hypothetical protein